MTIARIIAGLALALGLLQAAAAFADDLMPMDTTGVDPDLLNTRGLPAFNVKLYAVNAAGECAGAALYGGDAVQYAVCTENGGELRTCEALIDKGNEFVD